jgi:hypothetical protein
MSSLVTIRVADTTHQNFIKSAWLKSYFNGKSAFCENLSPEIFFPHHQSIVEKLICRSTVLVAMSRDTIDVAVGFIAFEKPNIVHYVYTKHQFKRFGIAKELFNATELDPKSFVYSHRTRDANWLIGYDTKDKHPDGTVTRRFVPGKLPEGTYNPYKAMR